MMGVMTLEDARPRSQANAVADDSFEAAFPELYPRAFGVANRLLGNRAAAEDVAAETMAKALIRWHKLDGDRVAGWVIRTAGNHAVDLMRKKGRTLEMGVIDLEDQTTLRISVAQAVRKLPKRQREAVVLRFLSDMSEAETARQLGISVGSVKTHTSRGLASLRNELSPEMLEAVGAGSN